MYTIQKSFAPTKGSGKYEIDRKTWLSLLSFKLVSCRLFSLFAWKLITHQVKKNRTVFFKKNQGFTIKNLQIMPEKTVLTFSWPYKSAPFSCPSKYSWARMSSQIRKSIQILVFLSSPRSFLLLHKQECRRKASRICRRELEDRLCFMTNLS